MVRFKHVVKFLAMTFVAKHYCIYPTHAYIIMYFRHTIPPTSSFAAAPLYPSVARARVNATTTMTTMMTTTFCVHYCLSPYTHEIILLRHNVIYLHVCCSSNRRLCTQTDRYDTEFFFGFTPLWFTTAGLVTPWARALFRENGRKNYN